MDHTTNLVYRQEAHEYVEIQNQDTYPGVYEEDPVAVKVFSAGAARCIIEAGAGATKCRFCSAFCFGLCVERKRRPSRRWREQTRTRK